MGRPRTPQKEKLNRAIVTLRVSGFTARETALILNTEMRNQEKIFKRDIERFFPEILECVSIIKQAIKEIKKQ